MTALHPPSTSINSLLFTPFRIEIGNKDFDLFLEEPASRLCLCLVPLLKADLLGGTLGGGGGNIDIGGNLLSSSSGMGTIGSVDCRDGVRDGVCKGICENDGVRPGVCSGGVGMLLTSSVEDVSEGVANSVDSTSARLNVSLSLVVGTVASVAVLCIISE